MISQPSGAPGHFQAQVRTYKRLVSRFPNLFSVALTLIAFRLLFRNDRHFTKFLYINNAVALTIITSSPVDA